MGEINLITIEFISNVYIHHPLFGPQDKGGLRVQLHSAVNS